MIRSALLTILLGLLPASAEPLCNEVTGPDIKGTDLARALPALHALPAEFVFAPSPLPGATRLFSSAEVQSIASRFGITQSGLADVCFRIATEAFDRTRLAEVMKAALGIPELQIDVLELSAAQIPTGQMEFRREGLGSQPGSDRNLPLVWNGAVIYAGQRRYSVWARVKLTAPVRKLIAVENLRQGQMLSAEQIREEVVDGFPLVSGRQITISALSGMIMAKNITAGQEIRHSDLMRPNDVSRGDLVNVEARLGAIRLNLTGRAESGGHVGDWIQVRNTSTSRVFQARVDAAGVVVVALPNPALHSLLHDEKGAIE